jgi:hypothetical protein
VCGLWICHQVDVWMVVLAASSSAATGTAGGAGAASTATATATATAGASETLTTGSSHAAGAPTAGAAADSPRKRMSANKLGGQGALSCCFCVCMPRVFCVVLSYGRSSFLFCFCVFVFVFSHTHIPPPPPLALLLSASFDMISCTTRGSTCCRELWCHLLLCFQQQRGWGCALWLTTCRHVGHVRPCRAAARGGCGGHPKRQAVGGRRDDCPARAVRP